MNRTINVALLSAVATLQILQPNSLTADETPGPLAAKERTAFQAELQPLQDQLAALKNAPNISLDRWADAQIFIKGVIWALDFGPVNNAQSRQVVKRGLQRAKERIDALSAGQAPWAERRGRSVRGFISAVDNTVQPYGLVVPVSYDSATPIRLDVVLHGSTRATGLGELLYINRHDGGDTGAGTGPNNPHIEVHPMGRLGENAYRFEGETDVDEAIAAVCRNYNIDRSRIVLRGSSLGGVGAWQLGLKRPDKFVAVGPAAGPVDTFVFANSPWKHFVRLDPLTPWQKTMLHLVDAIDYTANAGMVPVVAAMGDQDAYFSSHLLIEKAFAKEGIPFDGIVAKGAGHGLSAAARQTQLQRLGEHASKGIDPFPKHIRFVTWTLKFSRCHWIEVLGLTKHYQRAEIDVQVADDGAIILSEPQNITRFAIHPPAVEQLNDSVVIGDIPVALPTNRTDRSRPLLFEKLAQKWTCSGTYAPGELSGKRPGLQGPIDDAFARPFLCVRGTGQAWNEDVAAWADANLKRFEDEWRRHYRGYLPVKDDILVTESDVQRCNLILFGDPGSNSWITKILPDLPARWARDTMQLGAKKYSAADHGLQLISPNPLPGAAGRYVVLNSGHTYHDAELRFSYMVFPRLGDWAVQKVGADHSVTPTPQVSEIVVDSGFFDEAWNPPAQP